ncbi:TrbC/VirB2 family protein [Wolbachia endosymbiont of Pentidionis agamae]|uniref:TrbC/VirB2 family protein n=1 Tax=Wolbachia endosymbiont of Pentidionis agamae TaxID=3110435 RepID=UPI002FCFB3C4
MKYYIFFIFAFFFAFDSHATDTQVIICNVVGYIHSIGGPLMTVVIIGSSILAIFGRMAWPALVALVIFCGVFFGASTVVDKMAGDGKGCKKCEGNQKLVITSDGKLDCQ